MCNIVFMDIVNLPIQFVVYCIICICSDHVVLATYVYILVRAPLTMGLLCRYNYYNYLLDYDYSYTIISFESLTIDYIIATYVTQIIIILLYCYPLTTTIE